MNLERLLVQVSYCCFQLRRIGERPYFRFHFFKLAAPHGKDVAERFALFRTLSGCRDE